MHAGNDLRKIKCLDGLYFSFELLDFNFHGLHETCCTIIADNKNIVPALSRCWSIIDQIHRIREISQAMPGLNKKNELLLPFLNETKVVEECRHYIQHLRTELLAKPPHPFPVWGSLSWVDSQDKNKTHTAMIGTPIGETGYSGCVYDREEKKWVSTVTLAVKNISVNFDLVHEVTCKFKEFILPWILQTYNSEIRITDKIPIVSVSIATAS